jgi:hypothetical protein
MRLAALRRRPDGGLDKPHACAARTQMTRILSPWSRIYYAKIFRLRKKRTP